MLDPSLGMINPKLGLLDPDPRNDQPEGRVARLGLRVGQSEARDAQPAPRVDQPEGRVARAGPRE